MYLKERETKNGERERERDNSKFAYNVSYKSFENS